MIREETQGWQGTIREGDTDDEGPLLNIARTPDGLVILDQPQYPTDTGTGIAIKRIGDELRIGIYWDGDERQVLWIPVDEIRRLGL